MPVSSLQEMVPTREWGEPMDGPAAPGLKRFSIEHLPNPLLALGLADVVWARGFLHKIEIDLQELHRLRMSQPMAMTVNGLSYAPMARIEADLDELERRGRQEAVERARLERAQAREENARLSRAGQPVGVDGAPGVMGGELLNEAAARLSDELWSASAGNLDLATSVLDRFWAKFSQESFRTPDLMSLLLVSHEEVLWEQEGLSPNVGGAGSVSDAMRVGTPSLHLQAQNAQSGAVVEEMVAGGPGRSFSESDIQIVATAPQMPGAAMVVPLNEIRSEFSKPVGKEKILRGPSAVAVNDGRIRSAMKADVEVRLISIREMLWHYFAAYPQDYPAALANVLNLSLAQVSDAGVLDERIALEVARCGSWSLALRVWQEIVKHQKAREATEGDGPWGGSAKKGAAVRGGGAGTPVFEGMVPPRPRSGRTWWSWSPNWGGLNFGTALRSLARMIFAS